MDTEQLENEMGALALKLYRTEELLKDAQESIRRANNWRDEQKRQAGYNSNVSFDIVWKEVLAKARKFDEMNSEAKER